MHLLAPSERGLSVAKNWTGPSDIMISGVKPFKCSSNHCHSPSACLNYGGKGPSLA